MMRKETSARNGTSVARLWGVLLVALLAITMSATSCSQSLGDDHGSPEEESPTGPQFESVQWSRVADAPEGRLEAQGGAVGDALYVFGGFESWSPYRTLTASHKFVPLTNEWTRLADMPEAWTHGSMAVDGNNIYLAGGWTNPNTKEFEERDTIMDGEASVYRYDIASDAWHSDVPELPERRGAGALVRVGRSLHFFGGHEGRLATHVDSGSHWVLSLDDMASGWTPLTPMPNPRNHLGAAVLDDQIYAIGGQLDYNEAAVAQTDVHRYDPATDRWESVASLPFPLSHTTASTFTVGSQILVLGGEMGHNSYVDAVLVYDPVANTWTQLNDLPVALNAAVAGEINGSLYFSGGGANFSTDTLEGIGGD